MLKLGIVLVLIILLFLMSSPLKAITEPFSCMSRHYYKDENDQFVPLTNKICAYFTEEECADFQEECVFSNIDQDKLKRENSDEVNTMLESMVHTCMIPNPDVVMNQKCLKNELRKSAASTKSGKRRIGRGSVSGTRKSSLNYDEIIRKCRLKPSSTYEKYILDKDCELFA